MAPPSEFTGHSLARRTSFSKSSPTPKPIVDAPAQASYAPNYSEQPAAPDAVDAPAATDAPADAPADAAADELLADELPARRFSTEDFFTAEEPPPAAAAPPPAEPPAAEPPPLAEAPAPAATEPAAAAEPEPPAATEPATAAAEPVPAVAEPAPAVEAAAPDDPASPARRESVEPLSTSAVEVSLEPPSPAISDGILSTSNEGVSP